MNYLFAAILFTTSLFASYETPYRLLTAKDSQGFSVEMDDGAMWRITDNGSAAVVTQWRSNDSLVIHPTMFSSLSGGRFYILNERLRTAAVAELSYGPILGRPGNSRIIYIDSMNCAVQLQDGTGKTVMFRLNPNDRFLFQKWQYGDTIILGSNQNCYAGWLSTYPYILINFESDNYVRATLN